MNGCECVVEHIIFDEREPPRHTNLTGVSVVQLKYLPLQLFVRVPDVEWEMPPHVAKELPQDICRKGLLLLEPKIDYLSTSHDIEEEVRPGVKQRAKVEINFRRSQCALIPASVRTLYAAQGESWHAVVVDLAKPPVMSRKGGETSKKLFWLACYVMISRAKTLGGLLILRLPAAQELNAGPPDYIIEEIDRTLSLEKDSENLLHRRLVEITGVLPSDISQCVSHRRLILKRKRLT